MVVAGLGGEKRWSCRRIWETDFRVEVIFLQDLPFCWSLVSTPLNQVGVRRVVSVLGRSWRLVCNDLILGVR
jgi:hypothetical protein